MMDIPEGEAPKKVRHIPTHTTWRGMIDRTTQPTHKSYPVYGGRGIRVCARWRSFANFVADMGERPEGHRIDRIDPDGGYSCGHADCPDCGPGKVRPNCRWLTVSESASRRRGVRTVLVDGREVTLAALARTFGICRSTVQGRAARGWSLSRIFGPSNN